MAKLKEKKKFKKKERKKHGKRERKKKKKKMCIRIIKFSSFLIFPPFHLADKQTAVTQDKKEARVGIKKGGKSEFYHAEISQVLLLASVIIIVKDTRLPPFVETTKKQYNSSRPCQ